MAHQLNVSGTALDKLLDSSEHPAWQDVVDGLHTSSSPQEITGGSETTFTNNGSVRNETSFPDHITELWDTTNSIAHFEEELNAPVYVARLEFTIDPQATGTVDFKMYVNDDTPKLLQTTTVSYKNAIDRVSSLFTFYLGDAAGYDVKNDGVYFTITPSSDVDIYDKTLLIYRT